MLDPRPVTPRSPDWVRPLGATGLDVSAVSLGGGPLGGMPDLFGYDNPAAEGVELARQAVLSPLRVIDTANGYSGGRSEERIGQALADLGPERTAGFLVVTKVDAADGDYSGRRVRDSVRESQERLGMQFLPLVHLHDPEFHPDAGFELPGGAIEALVALRAEGVIGHLGVAGGHTPTLHRMLDTGAFEVVLTHSRLTLLDRGADDLLDRCRDEGLGTVNAAVLGGGLLAKRSSKPLYGFRPARPEVLAAAAALHDLADELGVPLADAALQHSLRDPRVDTTVVGLSSPRRLPGLVAALDTDVPHEFWERAARLLPPREVWLDS
ncbi:aldo/keto reductase [Kineococcus sp. TBRC 1896]|uniref:Aldo/keto reductase n=1 Tax=Kineococcus mangrovi TaxID=1660183 RepID=A0ABV4I7X3_9ACTN